MGTNRISAYRGEKPFAFISYAHADSERVMPIIGKLQEDGYRVWFDEGIEAGIEWARIIAKRLKMSSCLIAFATQNYLNSENCIDEIELAKDKKIPRLIVYLDDLTLPDWFQMRHNRHQAIYCSQYGTDERFFSRLYEARMLQCCHKDACDDDFGINGRVLALINELYEILVKYRCALRKGDVASISDTMSKMQTTLQMLYDASELYQVSDKKTANVAASIVNQYNKFTERYNAFVGSEDKMSDEAQRYAMQAEKEFNELNAIVAKILS